METKGHGRTLVALACLAAAIAVAGAGTPTHAGAGKARPLVRDGWTAIAVGHAPIGEGGADREVLYLVSHPNDVFAVALYDPIGRVAVIQSFDWLVMSRSGAPVMPQGFSFSEDPLAVHVWDHTNSGLDQAPVVNVYRWENGFLRYVETSDYSHVSLPRIGTRCVNAGGFTFWIDGTGMLHSADAGQHACGP